MYRGGSLGEGTYFAASAGYSMSYLTKGGLAPAPALSAFALPPPLAAWNLQLNVGGGPALLNMMGMPWAAPPPPPPPPGVPLGAGGCVRRPLRFTEC